MNLETDSSAVAKLLIECDAVTFRTDPPYQFTSGTLSPVYVDNRRLLGFVDARREVTSRLAEVLKRSPIDAVAGTATAGIPWASWLAEELSCPLLYVRSEAKGWGHGNAIEGRVIENSRVAVVEDLIYTGGSVRGAVANLREAGLVVETCVSIVTYNTGHDLASLGLAVNSLTTIDDALAAAVEAGKVVESQRAVVQAWLSGIRDCE